MIAPARVAAYETVLAVAGGRADLPTALARARQGLKDDRDRALAGEIAAGAIRWQGAADHLVREGRGQIRAPARDGEDCFVGRDSCWCNHFLPGGFAPPVPPQERSRACVP